jgi:hypothetical protein
MTNQILIIEGEGKNSWREIGGERKMFIQFEASSV